MNSDRSRLVSGPKESCSDLKYRCWDWWTLLCKVLHHAVPQGHLDLYRPPFINKYPPQILLQNILIFVHCGRVKMKFSTSYTTQKKFRISCAYLFVLSTSNSCRLWRGLQIKVQFSEDVSYMTISNFCEKQFVLNDITLIAKKHFFTQQYKTSLIVCLINIFNTIV